ncbi:MAG: hypothetical protein Q8M76_08980, partial [Spirochaetaceae bacterium]|nr:hypothetical protein [Spirochaetaceae bacterium]
EIKVFEAEGATPFRFAGNELGLVLPGLGRAEARATAARLARLLSSLDLAAALGACDPAQGAPQLSISAGIALHPDHGSAAGLLIAAVNELPLAGRARGGNMILFPEDVA